MNDREPPPHLVAAVDQAAALAREGKRDLPLAAEERRCVAPPAGCGQPLPSLASAFVDRASRAEYDITGLCQKCQDRTFAPSDEERAEMDVRPELYDRCPVCGEYREIEHVNVGVGVMSGFNCCYLEYAMAEVAEQLGKKPWPPRCTKFPGCRFCENHAYGCAP